jgi:hypothetical protein
MDPKTLANLDPKLRETYEKVMGTSTTPSPQAATPGNSTPTPKPSSLIPGLIKPKTQPAPTPPIPSPVSSPLPNIPAPANPFIAPNNSTVVTAPSPVQTSDFATLQATPTGAPLPTPQVQNAQPRNLTQPLPSPASINKAAPSTHSSPIIRTLYIIASIVFFAVYIIFWLKILKYPLPF